MSILAVGGEADCFQLDGAAYLWDTTAGRFDADASRGALKVTQATAELFLPFPSVTEVWIHAYLYQESVAASDYIIINGDDGNAFKIALESNGRYSLYKWSGASWGSALATSASPVLVDAAGAIDIYILMDVSGEFTVYLDGVSVVTYSGDTTGDSTDMNGVTFVGLTGGTNEMFVSQVIVADEDTTGMVLATLPVTGVGTAADWVGTYADIDEAALNTGDNIAIGEGDAVSTFAMTDIGSWANLYLAKALAIGISTAIDPASNVDNVQAAVRVGGTNYFSASADNMAKDDNYYANSFVFDLNPDGDIAWTKVAINGAEIGVKSIDDV